MQTRSGLALAPIVPGLFAGLIGAVLIDAYLLITVVAVTHRTSVSGFYQFVASSAIGRSAYGEPSAVWLGLAMHVAVSLAWGVGYAFVAAGTPQLSARPVTSGIVFGIVVMLAMQLVEVAAGTYELPNTASLLNAFFAHTIFFGVPVAYVTARRLARP